MFLEVGFFSHNDLINTFIKIFTMYVGDLANKHQITIIFKDEFIYWIIVSNCK